MAAYREDGGGKPEIQSHLLPPRVVVSAIVILYLCESGTNSEVALAMRQSAISKSATPRHLNVAGRKGRSGNRAIFTELPMQEHGGGLHQRGRGTAVLSRGSSRRRDRPTGKHPSSCTSARGAVRALEAVAAPRRH